MIFERLAEKAASQKHELTSRLIDEPNPSAGLPEAQQRRLALVDSPSPFDTLEIWEVYLEELRAMPDFDLLPLMIEHAEETIAKRRQQSNAR